MKITLIYGGKSGEHEISLVSAAAIARIEAHGGTVTIHVLVLLESQKLENGFFRTIPSLKG